jgi:Bacterial Ig-like domain
MIGTPRFALLALAASFATAACSGSSANAPTPTGPAASAQVIGVSPAGGSTGVDPNAAIVIGFSHAMPMADDMYATLHQDSLTGPLVTGTASWSADSTTLTFRPAAPLRSMTTYVLHLGGAMHDEAGNVVDLSRCGQWGGRAATSGMMGGGIGGGMMGGGSGAGAGNGEMGPGWQTPGASTYGMVFTFTTA